MVKAAFVFPGQGSQYVGMSKEFYVALPAAREMFAQASAIAGLDLAELCFNGPEDALTLTQNAQPAILLASIIALKSLGEHGIESGLVAGHSLGEYSANVAANALDFADAVRLVRLRGQFMQEAVPVGIGAMAAIIGLPPEKIQEICDSISTDACLAQPANMNSPEQVVISGHKSAVEEVSRAVKAAGAKKAIMLPVSAPFHCTLMKPAEIKLRAVLEATNFRDPRVPVITNCDAQPVRDGANARAALVRQVCSPVRWVETMQCMLNQGARAVVEIGPGKVLSGLMRRFNKDIPCFQVEDLASLEKTAQAIKALGVTA